MVRVYFCTFIGTGIISDPYRLDIYSGITTQSRELDTREMPELGEGEAIVWANYTDAEHTLMLANPTVTYINLEGGGIPLPLTATVSQLDTLQATKTLLEAHGYDFTGFTASNTIRDVLRRVYRTAVLRYDSPYLVFDNGVDAAQSLSAKQLRGLKRRFTNRGFDASAITATDTLRQIFTKLYSQNTITEFN